MGRAVDERIERDESDDLALRDLHAFLQRERADHLERFLERCPVVVDHVHRDLHEAPFGECEAFRADRRESAVALPDRLRDAFRDPDVGRPKVHIPRDQDRPGPDDARAGGRVQARGAEIRLPVRVRLDIDLEAFVFAAPHVREGAPVGPGCGRLVQVDGDVEFVRDPLADGARQGDAILHRHARDRDERKDIEGAHTRMLAAMRVHVDPLDRRGRSSKCRFGHRPPVSDERDHGAVVVRVHLDVQDPRSGDGRDRGPERIDDVLAPAFRKVRHALDDLDHPGLQGTRRSRRFLKTFLGTPEPRPGWEMYK